MKYIFIISRYDGKVDRYKLNQTQFDFYVETFGGLDKIKSPDRIYRLKMVRDYLSFKIYYYDEKLRFFAKIKKKFLFDF